MESGLANEYAIDRTPRAHRAHHHEPPERHNAFDDVLIAELTEALRSMEAEDGIRVVVLSGAGKSFSAGADLNWMKRMAGFSKEENQRDAMALGALMRTLAHLRSRPLRACTARPTAAAWGSSPAATSRSPHRPPRSRSPRRKLGLIPAVISPYVVSAIGERAARRYFLTAERFDAAEAWRLGLVHDLGASAEDMDEKIGTIIDAMLTCGPVAQREAKELIRAVAHRLSRAK